VIGGELKNLTNIFRYSLSFYYLLCPTLFSFRLRGD